MGINYIARRISHTGALVSGVQLIGKARIREGRIKAARCGAVGEANRAAISSSASTFRSSMPMFANAENVGFPPFSAPCVENRHVD